jgi:hypothetical protein
VIRVVTAAMRERWLTLLLEVAASAGLLVVKQFISKGVSVSETVSAATDTAGLLTILALVAAVWALVPSTARLNFRLRLGRLDWTIIFGGILIVHYLVFEGVLRAAGLYYSFGPWKYNLEKSSVTYLIVLGLALYVFIRSRSTKLIRRKMPIFSKLFNTLLMSKQYAELALLLEDHQQTILTFPEVLPIRDRMAGRIRAPTQQSAISFADGKIKVMLPPPPTTFAKVRNFIASRFETDSAPQSQAREVRRKLLASAHFTRYLASSYPYLGLTILTHSSTHDSEFQDNYFEALINDESSIFYSELKNNQNLAGGYRLALPHENRLLCFFFKEISVAANLGVYRSVGEPVCRLIDTDKNLRDAYNGPLGYYDDVGKHKCPIFCGIHFFQIMVLEGLHQCKQDHLWLFYFTHFTDRILKQLREIKADDSHHEFPSPFHYLLYRIVAVAVEWIEEAENLTDKSALVLKGTGLNDDNGYIPFSAASAIGQILCSILSSEKIDDRFKTYILEVVLGRLVRFSRIPEMAQLSRVLEKAIIYRGSIWTTDRAYRGTLQRVYLRIDPALRSETKVFSEELERALAEKPDGD